MVVFKHIKNTNNCVNPPTCNTNVEKPDSTLFLPLFNTISTINLTNFANCQSNCVAGHLYDYLDQTAETSIIFDASKFKYWQLYDDNYNPDTELNGDSDSLSGIFTNGVEGGIYIIENVSAYNIRLKIKQSLGGLIPSAFMSDCTLTIEAGYNPSEENTAERNRVMVTILYIGGQFRILSTIKTALPARIPPESITNQENTVNEENTVN